MEKRDGNRLGELIKERRIRKGFSQTEFAKMLGIGKSWLCQLENGTQYNPSAPLLIAIAVRLDISLWELADAYKHTNGLKIPWSLLLMGSNPILGIAEHGGLWRCKGLSTLSTTALKP